MDCVGAHLTNSCSEVVVEELSQPGVASNDDGDHLS
jgi:hypothetical protein